MSRYYDASIGRFINADGYVSTGQDALGHNMFLYCGNNPINKVDPFGFFWITVASATSMAGVNNLYKAEHTVNGLIVGATLDASLGTGYNMVGEATVKAISVQNESPNKVAKRLRRIANTRIVGRKIIILKPRMSSGPRPK